MYRIYRNAKKHPGTQSIAYFIYSTGESIETSLNPNHTEFIVFVIVYARFFIRPEEKKRKQTKNELSMEGRTTPKQKLPKQNQREISKNVFTQKIPIVLASAHSVTHTMVCGLLIFPHLILCIKISSIIGTRESVRFASFFLRYRHHRRRPVIYGHPFKCIFSAMVSVSTPNYFIRHRRINIQTLSVFIEGVREREIQCIHGVNIYSQLAVDFSLCLVLHPNLVSRIHNISVGLDMEIAIKFKSHGCVYEKRRSESAQKMHRDLIKYLQSLKCHPINFSIQADKL